MITVNNDKLNYCLMCDVQAQVVLAFEQSLTNMTQRLQHLALTANKKVSKVITEVLTIWVYRIECLI